MNAAQVVTQLTGLPAYDSFRQANDALDGYVKAQVEVVKLSLRTTDGGTVDVWVIRRREEGA